MVYLVIFAVLAALTFAGWKLTSRNAYESAAYTVITSDGAIELRKYPDLMMVTTDMKFRSQGDDGSFGRLFKYISGGNDEKQKVAMTTPVFMEPETAESKGQMGFVIPRKIAETKIPQPDSQQVLLTKRPGGKFAVLRFAGRSSPQVVAEQQKKLEAWIDQQGYRAASEPEIAGYDPPWTPGALRRNEILIRILPE